MTYISSQTWAELLYYYHSAELLPPPTLQGHRDPSQFSKISSMGGAELLAPQAPGMKHKGTSISADETWGRVRGLGRGEGGNMRAAVEVYSSRPPSAVCKWAQRGWPGRTWKCHLGTTTPWRPPTQWAGPAGKDLETSSKRREVRGTLQIASRRKVRRARNSASPDCTRVKITPP